MPYSFTCIDHINKSIEFAKNGVSKLPLEILDLPGMSSYKVRHFLNNLCGRFPGHVYLEVGCYKGSTLISAGYANNVKLIGIDNWSEFDAPKDEFMSNVNKWIPDNNLWFLDQNAFSVGLDRFNDKIGIYFYDGSHDVASQIQAFTYFNQILDNVFITIIDDWNMDSVKLGTNEAFRSLKYTVLDFWELPAKFNGDTENWWNGLYIAVVRK
jgi:hypothetical protein